MMPRRRHAERRPAQVQRDQHESAFTSILANLVKRVPGARAAALVDREGETADYAGRVPAYDVRLAAAYWRIVLEEARGSRSLRTTLSIGVRAARTSYLVHALPEGYALVLVLMRTAGFSGWARAIASCARELCVEAGWGAGALAPSPWFAVAVECDRLGRPASVASARGPRSVEILGSVASGLARGERGWRVRLDSCLEATVVREAGGAWYMDEPSNPVWLDPGEKAIDR